MTPRQRKPHKLSDLLDDYLSNHPEKKALKRGVVLSIWPRIIGERIRQQVREIHFKGDRLIMHVSDPSWRHEIHMQRHQMAAKLNKEVKEQVIREIVVKS